MVAASKSRQFRTLYLCYVLFSKPLKVFFSFSKNIKCLKYYHVVISIFVVRCVCTKMPVFFKELLKNMTSLRKKHV